MPEQTRWNSAWSSTGQEMLERFTAGWCKLMHDSAVWPIHGQYQCRTCGRHYPVPWAAPAMPRPVAQVRALRVPSALLPLMVLVLLAAGSMRAGEAVSVPAHDAPGLAFARYLAGLDKSAPWSVETVEIDASLPKMEKAARLLAMRTISPAGTPEYQVIESTGDTTVKRQVIVRYLSADVEAAAIPARSAEISPANYWFRYKGEITSGGRTAYAFLITPRKKRQGLIKGEIWLDGETGAVMRQSGYLVKSPSLFVKRVDITRDAELRGGATAARTTHLSVNTRLVGRAELTVLERPAPDAGRPAPAAVGEPLD